MLGERFETVVSLLTRESGFEWILSSAPPPLPLFLLPRVHRLRRFVARHATGMSVRPSASARSGPGMGLEGAWKGREGGGSKREEGRKEGMDIGKLTDDERGREGQRRAGNEKAVLHSTLPHPFVPSSRSSSAHTR